MLKLTKNEVRNMCIADQAAYINEVCTSCGSDPYFYIDDWYNVYDVEDLTASSEPDEDAEPIGDSDWMWEYILDLNYEGTGICGRVFATEDEIFSRMANDPQFDDIWTREGLYNYITANYVDTGLEYDDRVYGAAMATFDENPEDHYFRWFCECVLPVDLEQRWDSANANLRG